MFKFLLPNYFKKIGWGLILLSISLAIMELVGGLNTKQKEAAIICVMLIGFGLIIISKEKDEDEWTMLLAYYGNFRKYLKDEK